MNQINYFVLTVLFALMSSACKVHVFDAKLISMTTDKLPTKLSKKQEVEESWCMKDEKGTKDFSTGPGYVDRVVLKAQKKHKAKYIADASFFLKGTCVIMTGRVVP